MIALDTNILVYARRAETVQHAQAMSMLKELAQGDQPWAITWPCVLDDLDSIFQSPR